jgi:hypothetical protein
MTFATKLAAVYCHFRHQVSFLHLPSAVSFEQSIFPLYLFRNSVFIKRNKK